MGAKAKICDNTMIVILFVVAFAAAIIFGIMWGECDGKSCSEHGCVNKGDATADYKAGVVHGCLSKCTALEGTDKTNCQTACYSETATTLTTQTETDVCITTCFASINNALLANKMLDSDKLGYQQQCVNGCANSKKYRDCVKKPPTGKSAYQC
jgi:hypothetical protein